MFLPILLLLKLSLQVHSDVVVAAEPKMSHHRLDAEHADLFLRYQIRVWHLGVHLVAAESIRALNASSAARTIRDSALRLTNLELGSQDQLLGGKQLLFSFRRRQV